MVRRNFGMDTEPSSSSNDIPLIPRCRTQNPRVVQSKSPSTLETRIPRKPINTLKAYDSKFKRMSRKDLLEVLMKHPNPEVGKSVVIDVESDSEEIDETYNTLKKKELPLKKRMFLWKAVVYRIDLEFNKPKGRTHLNWGKGIKNPDKIKNLIGLDYSHFIVEAYNVKFPSGRMVSIPLEHERVCLYTFNNFALYLERFALGIRLPFYSYVKDIFNYF